MGDFARKVAKLGKPAKNIRVLVFDLENSPNIVHTWGLFKQNIGLSQIVTPATTFGFAAKWVGDPKPAFHSDHHDGHAEMVKKAWELLNEADIVVTYNGIGFDIPHIQREFLLAGLTPPKPFKQIDLLRVIRKQFRFSSNKLDFVSQQLGIGKKTSHMGHELWVRCLANDPKAWALMAKYAKQDVSLTEKLYHYLMPWLTSVPHIGQMAGVEHSCPYCGGDKLKRDGTAHAFVTSYRLFECLNCHAWVRGTTKLQDATRTRPMAIN